MESRIFLLISFIPCTSLFPSLLSLLLLSHSFIFPAHQHSSPPSFHLLLHVNVIPLPIIFHSPVPLFPSLPSPAFISHPVLFLHPDNSAFSFSHSARNWLIFIWTHFSYHFVSNGSNISHLRYFVCYFGSWILEAPRFIGNLCRHASGNVE